MLKAARTGLALMVLAGACSDGGAPAPVERVALASTTSGATTTSAVDAPTTSTSTTSTTSTTTTTIPTIPTTAVDDREAEILAVIDLYWHTGVEANDPPDADHELLTQVAAGDLLDHIRSVAVEKLAAGEGNRYRDGRVDVVRRAQIARLEDGLAIVNICLVDDTLLYDLETDEILDDELRIRWLQHAVELTGDGWRVVRALLIERLTSEDLCDSAF